MALYLATTDNLAHRIYCNYKSAPVKIGWINSDLSNQAAYLALIGLIGRSQIVLHLTTFKGARKIGRFVRLILLDVAKGHRELCLLASELADL